MAHQLRIAGDGVEQAVPAVIDQLAVATQPRTLEELLQLGFAQRPAWELVDVIVQDEYTHDVVVRGPAPAFLVFDTT